MSNVEADAGAKVSDAVAGGKDSQETQNQKPQKGAAVPMYRQWGELVLAVTFDLLIVIFSIIFLYWSFKAGGVVLFSWHPALFSLGFICFMTEALLMFSGASLMSRLIQSYKGRVQAHWILQSFGIVCIFLGFTAIVTNKIIHEKSHFVSTHSICGLTTVICCVLSISGGVATKYSVKLMKKIRPVKLKVGHALFGIVTYILGGITLILSLYTGWYEKHRSPAERCFAIVAIVLIWAYAIYNPIKIAYKRLYRMYVSI